MSETLKAVEAAAYRLAKAQTAREVVQRSLNGIIAEQERRAAAKKMAQPSAATDSIMPSSMTTTGTPGEPPAR